MHDDKKNGCGGDDHEADEVHCVPVSWASLKIDVANYVNMQICLSSFVYKVVDANKIPGKA